MSKCFSFVNCASVQNVFIHIPINYVVFICSVLLKLTLKLLLCILESSWVDSFPLEVSPAVLALRLALYAARSVLRASKYQVEIQKEIFIYPSDLLKPNTYIKLNTKTQNIFCCLNGNLTIFLYTLTVFFFKVYTKSECY